jgi:C1A family cysteine protease
MTAGPRRFYGCIPDRPDARDRLYQAPAPGPAGLPARVDLRPGCPAVYDQGELNSCTANAIAGALEFLQRKEGLPQMFVPSRLFIYYNERAMEGTEDEDAGAEIRDGIATVAQQGAPPETLWPYDPGLVLSRPDARAYQVALEHTAILYLRLSQDLLDARACLASGDPFVFGMTVYESFEDEATVGRTGVVPLPAPGEAAVGRHAVLAVGYDDASARLIVRNSWGPAWGQGGYFTLPYAYVTDAALAADFWTIRTVV